MRAAQLSFVLIVFSACLPMRAHAAPECGVDSNAVTYTTDMGPRHHPIGRSLPQRADFNQPTPCGDHVWFFDLNLNGRPDPGEPRVFGATRLIACNSCHAASPDVKTETAASVFLRQDVGMLCLICHRL